MGHLESSKRVNLCETGGEKIKEGMQAIVFSPVFCNVLADGFDDIDSGRGCFRGGCGFRGLFKDGRAVQSDALLNFFRFGRNLCLRNYTFPLIVT